MSVFMAAFFVGVVFMAAFFVGVVFMAAFPVVNVVFMGVLRLVVFDDAGYYRCFSILKLATRRQKP